MNNHNYKVKYVPKELIEPAFGYAKNNEAVVREDLRPRVKKFVIEHELYHLKDKSNRGGWLGKELRANLAAGMKFPVGFIETVCASMTKSRLTFYVDRFRGREPKF